MKKIKIPKCHFKIKIMLKIIKNIFPKHQNAAYAKVGDIVKIARGDLVRISDNKIVFSKPPLLFTKPKNGIIAKVKCRNEILQVEPYFKDIPDVIISIQFYKCMAGYNSIAGVAANKEKTEAYLNHYNIHSRKGAELFFSAQNISEFKSDVPGKKALLFCEKSEYSYCFG